MGQFDSGTKEIYSLLQSTPSPYQRRSSDIATLAAIINKYTEVQPLASGNPRPKALDMHKVACKCKVARDLLPHLLFVAHTIRPSRGG